MDTSIRPKPSNHHKPRIRPRSFLGLWPKFQVLAPQYTAKHGAGGIVELVPYRHVLVDERMSLEKAIESAIEIMKSSPIAAVFKK